MKGDKRCILIADDEKEIRDILKLLLEGEGYEVIVATDGEEAVQKASEEVDLYILDINMPKLSGFVTAAEIRKIHKAPLVFLTAYSSDAEKVMGFAAGADDYIVKPFSNMELIMRVKAILRRTCGDGRSWIYQPKRQIPFGDLVLDLDSQCVYRGKETIILTYTEYKIVELLVTHKKKIYSLDNLYRSIWKEEVVGDGSIMVHIKNIRRKFGDNSRNPKYIKTAWGKGYYVD